MILLLACTTPPSIDAAWEDIDYGRFTTDADGLLSIPIEVEKGDIAGTLACGPYGFDATATLVDGGGLVTMAAPATDAFTVAWPQSPGAPPVGATELTLQFVSDNLPLTVECVGTRRLAEVPGSGSAPVELRFSGMNGIDQYSAGESAEWLAVQDLVEAAFSTAGITLDIRYADAAGTPGDTVDTAEAGALVKAGVDGDTGAVPIFLVQSLADAPGPGHIPGWYGAGGSGASGAVAAAGTYLVEPDTVAAGIIREIGHFLGLFHVEETDGTADPLADTDPASPNPMSRTDAGDTFTEDQAWVMRSSVAVD